ncbi:hypothetical protein M413DRAFT_14751 [Hebeloma cylindrosporum]|uniref:Uncharacterized protein n=1 Tax=Hebeloma cylindrosporum TaxID=76867 RepID=A0A0C2XAS8_HEBCY|nr:hypothetical protein M413DRAFT_14751 [Hebeloma cylindrosporum h7]
MGQSVSDLFYPDNPKRRNRAEQLREDILAYCNSYDEIKKARDEVLKEIRPRLATLLKNEGYDSPEALDAKVQSILTGDNLKYYLRVKALHDASSDLERTVFSISSYISIGSGVFLGGLALLGIITGGTAFAILGGVGLALAAIGASLVLFSVLAGEQERRNLKEAISKLGPERLNARRAQMMMQAISNWCRYIVRKKEYLDSAVVERNPDLAAEIWEGDFKADFAKSEHRPVVEWLINHDMERGAWTAEDGNWRYQDSGRSFSLVEMGNISSADTTSVSTSATEEKPKVVLQREGETPIYMVVLETAQELCIAEDDNGDKWAFMPETVTKKGVGVELDVQSYLFSIRKIATGEVLHDFGLVSFTPRA